MTYTTLVVVTEALGGWPNYLRVLRDRPEREIRILWLDSSKSALAIYRQRTRAVERRRGDSLIPLTSIVEDFYSVLSARIGSMDAARRAGTIAAIVAATKSSSTLPLTASGSMTGGS